MRKILLKNVKTRRKLRVRKSIFGNSTKPRLSIFRSNRFISGQIIDDTIGKTLVDVQSETRKFHDGKSKIAAAMEVGEVLAKKALAQKIKEVVFDRNGYRYHGRVKSFAEGARKGGLKF